MDLPKAKYWAQFLSASDVLAAGCEPTLGTELPGPGLAVCSQAVGYRWLEEGPTALSTYLRALTELYTGAYGVLCLGCLFSVPGRGP